MESKVEKSKIKFTYNYGKQEGVLDMNKTYFPNHFLMIIVGKPGSGKTSLMKFLLTSKDLLYKKFDYVFIISPSFLEYDSLFLPPGNFTNELDFVWIANKIKQYRDTPKYVNILFILDDVVADLHKNRMCKEIMNFIFNRRHLLNNGMISIIISSQKVSVIPTIVRVNTTIVITFMLSAIEFLKIKKDICFDEDRFDRVLKIVFEDRDKEETKPFLFYRVDNETYFKNFDKINL